MILKFFNLLFRIILIFLICFVWARYFISDLTLALVYTAILTAAIELLFHIFTQKKERKFSLKKEEQKLSEKISSNFILSPESAVEFFFELGKINYHATKHTKFVVLERKEEESKTKHNEKEKTVIYPLYSFSPLSAQNLIEILKAVRKINATKIVVCANKVSSEAISATKKIPNVKFILLDSNGVFLKLIKKNNFYPKDLKEINVEAKPSFKDFVKAAFSKKRAKGYLLASFVMLFSSFIVRTNIYYVVFSSILLIFSFISFFLSPRNIKYEEEII